MADLKTLGWILYLMSLVTGIGGNNVRLATDCDGPICLYLYKNNASYPTWQESYDMCRAEDLHLVRIESRQIQESAERLLKELHQNEPGLAWTAGRGSNDSEWKYMNGTTFTERVVPRNWWYVGENCLYVTLNRGEGNNIFYHSHNCDDKTSPYQVLCQYDASSTATGSCTHLDMPWDGKCYRKTVYDGGRRKIDWFGAQSHCSGDGMNGDIFYSNLQTLRNTFMNLVARDASAVQLWFGARRNIWQWKSGSDVASDRLPMDYFNWAGTYGRYSEYDKCVYIDHSEGDRWRHFPCSTNLRLFICMRDLAATTTATTATKPPTTQGSRLYTYQTVIIITTVAGALIIAAVAAVFLCKLKRSREAGARNVIVSNEINMDSIARPSTGPGLIRYEG